MSTAGDPNPDQEPGLSPSADMERFSDRLLHACKLAGLELGQTAIAKALGVPKQTVDRWMNDSLPRADQLFVVADKLRVDARWLATGDGEMRLAANEANVGASDVREHTKLVRMKGEEPAAKYSVGSAKRKADKKERK